MRKLRRTPKRRACVNYDMTREFLDSKIESKLDSIINNVIEAGLEEFQSNPFGEYVELYKGAYAQLFYKYSAEEGTEWHANYFIKTNNIKREVIL